MPTTLERWCGALAVGAMTLAAPRASLAQRAAPERVEFDAGATSAMLHGAVGGATPEREYRLRVRAGQRMRVRLHGRAGTSAEVFAPGAATPWTMGGVEAGGRWEARLLASGDHRIRVSHYGPAAARFTLSVAVEDAPAADAESPVGTFSREGGSSVVLRRASGGRLRFEVTAFWNAPRPYFREGVVHLGTASGTLRPRGNVAVWQQGDCRLVFRLDPERVYVQQVGTDVECDFGAHVSADGAYVRADAPRHRSARHARALRSHRAHRTRRPRG